jgi:hypothetical protein
MLEKGAEIVSKSVKFENEILEIVNSKIK